MTVVNVTATTQPISDLWTLVRGTPFVDPDDLLQAIERECRSGGADFRTRLLIRDSLAALNDFWGSDRLRKALSVNLRSAVDQLMTEPSGPPGFPTLRQRLANHTDTETILDFLRELGSEICESTRLEIGGSSALILGHLLRRGTDDIDVVNELPPAIRNQHQLLNRLASRHGLQLTHFQSHYLPDGYTARLHSLGQFKMVDVFLVDPLDIFVGKLCSRREKDLDDLRMMKSSFDESTILERVRSSPKLLGKPDFRQNAERNWYILFGTALTPTP